MKKQSTTKNYNDEIPTSILATKQKQQSQTNTLVSANSNVIAVLNKQKKHLVMFDNNQSDDPKMPSVILCLDGKD
jgi:hypothetical protein